MLGPGRGGGGAVMFGPGRGGAAGAAATGSMATTGEAGSIGASTAGAAATGSGAGAGAGTGSGLGAILASVGGAWSGSSTRACTAGATGCSTAGRGGGAAGRASPAGAAGAWVDGVANVRVGATGARVFFTSTATALLRPWLKLCRTMPVSTGFFSSRRPPPDGRDRPIRAARSWPFSSLMDGLCLHLLRC